MSRALRTLATVAAVAVVAGGAACGAAREGAPPAAASPGSTGAASAQPASAQPVPATVREVLDSRELVGRTVRVSGRCLGYAASRAAGPPPRTRSDWQLAAGDAAVWVTGPRPAGCATTGADADGEIEARVAEDTVPSLTGAAGWPRRYLVRAGR